MLVDTKEACIILGISKPTLLKYAEMLGGFKIGSQWRFIKEELEKGGLKK